MCCCRNFFWLNCVLIVDIVGLYFVCCFGLKKKKVFIFVLKFFIVKKKLIYVVCIFKIVFNREFFIDNEDCCFIKGKFLFDSFVFWI